MLRTSFAYGRGTMTFSELQQWLARDPELDDVFRQLVEADGGRGGWFQSIPAVWEQCLVGV